MQCLRGNPGAGLRSIPQCEPVIVKTDVNQCAATVEGIPDGQLQWIIKNGLSRTAVPSFAYPGDEEIWQLVIYLRSLSNHR